jgi:hypothetical protein
MTREKAIAIANEPWGKPGWKAVSDALGSSTAEKILNTLGGADFRIERRSSPIAAKVLLASIGQHRQAAGVAARAAVVNTGPRRPV